MDGRHANEIFSGMIWSWEKEKLCEDIILIKKNEEIAAVFEYSAVDLGRIFKD